MTMFREKKLTDEQYVERIRQKDRFVRKTIWMWPLVLILFVICTVMLVDIVHKVINTVPVERGIQIAGLALAAVFGFFLGFLVHQAGFSIKRWLDAKAGFRTERLMLKYHDELKKETASNQQLDGTRP